MMKRHGAMGFEGSFRYLMAIEVTRRSVSRNGSNVMMVHQDVLVCEQRDIDLLTCPAALLWLCNSTKKLNRDVMVVELGPLQKS
jgi:hypothetical protein